MKMCPCIAKIILNGSRAGQQDPAWLGFLETGVERQRLYKSLWFERRFYLQKISLNSFSYSGIFLNMSAGT